MTYDWTVARLKTRASHNPKQWRCNRDVVNQPALVCPAQPTLQHRARMAIISLRLFDDDYKHVTRRHSLGTHPSPPKRTVQARTQSQAWNKTSHGRAGALYATIDTLELTTVGATSTSQSYRPRPPTMSQRLVE